MLDEALESIAALMIEADERRRAARGDKHAVEADLKGAVHLVLDATASPSGVALRATELSISPTNWPGVGSVDVVLIPTDRPASPEAFVELKWARADKVVNALGQR